MFELFAHLIIAPFLKAYILIFGDDPEMIAYAGLAFVIYYSSVVVFAAAIYEVVVEHFHTDLYVKYFFKRRWMKRRVHQSVRRKKKKRELEERVKQRIRNESGEPVEAGK